MNKLLESYILKIEAIKSVIEDIRNLKTDVKQVTNDVLELSKSIISLAKTLELHHKSIRDIATIQAAIVNAAKNSGVDTSLPTKKTKQEKPN
jgi:septal ring factor EnvC (AmiA/AmiB activator)